MEVNEQMSEFDEFFNTYYKSELLEKVRMGEKYCIIDFNTLAEYNPELANLLLDNPEDVIKAADMAIEGMDLMGDVKDFKVRFKNLPESCRIPIWQIRQEVDKFIKLEGYVSEMGDVLIRPMANRYECPSCGEIKSVIRKDDFSSITEPTRCSCGKKGKGFRLVSQKKINIRKIVIEEDLMELKAKQTPKRKLATLTYDLAGSRIEPELMIGRKVIVNGWLKTYVANPKTGDMDTYFIVNSIEFIERGWPTIKVNRKEKKMLLKIAKDKDLVKNLGQSILPYIHGEEQAKEAVLLQLIGSRNVYGDAGRVEVRGCIHIALVGPPGTGKTEILKQMNKFWPIYRFSSAQTASGRGLIATAIQDKELDGKWVLVPGVIPTCSGGITAIDELDKMDKDEYGYLNNAMNDLCYDDKTEILTKNGWKLFKDINGDELVATLKDGYLSYDNITDYIEREYDGDMYHIKGRGLDFNITPNHLVYISFCKHIKSRVKIWTPYQLYPIKEVDINKLMRFKKNAIWIGEHQKYFYLPHIKKYKNQTDKKGTYTPIKKIDMDVWLEFLGWYISEGCTHKTKGVPYVTYISQRNRQNVRDIRNCLDKLGFKYSFDGKNFCICNKQLACYLYHLGKTHQKRVPPYVKELCPEQMSVILKSLISGDGYKVGKSFGYCSSSKRLIDDVQELILKVGYCGDVRIRTTHYKKPHYVIGVNTNHTNPQINHHKKQIKKTPYKGKIYCVTVPNHLIYVRRHGKAVWCGNSVTVDKAAHGIFDTDVAILASLNPEGRVFIHETPIYEQIKLPPDLLDRFDVVLPVFANVNEDDQRQVFRMGADKRKKKRKILPHYDTDTVIKYVAYARSIEPELSDDMERIVEDRVIKFMKPGSNSNPNKQVSNRVYGLVLRLVDAYARLHLRDKVTVDDLNSAMDLLVYSYKQQGLITSDGLLDFERAERVDIKAATVSQAVKDKINELSKQVSPIPIQDLVESLKDEYEEDKVEEVIERMKRVGDIFEPRRGFVQKVS